MKSMGPTSPYTLQILDMTASMWLTPFEWQQTARSVLCPGHYIMESRLRGWGQQNSARGVIKRGPRPTVAIILGKDDHASYQAQMRIPKAILGEISKIAVEAWR